MTTKRLLRARPAPAQSSPPSPSSALGWEEAPLPSRAEDAALAVLDLAPSADLSLVELAYWHHVEVCRATCQTAAAWRTRVGQLNAARHLLVSALTESQPRPASQPPSDSMAPRAVWLRALGVLALAAAALLLVALTIVAHNADGAWGAVRISSRGVFIAAGLGAVGIILLFSGYLRGRRHHQNGATTRSPSRSRAGDPYHVLGVLPSADQRLCNLALEYWTRRASRTGDASLGAALVQAHACLGTPAARAAWDARGADATAAQLTRTAQRARVISTKGRGRAGWRRVIRAVARGASAGLRSVRRWLGMLGTVAWRGTARIARRARRNRRAPGAFGGAVRPSAVLQPDQQPRRGRPLVHGPTIASPASEGRTSGTLQVEEGGREVLQVAIVEGRIYTIGAGAHCEVRLPATNAGCEPVAQEHARLSFQRGRPVFHHIDQDATSRINGEPVVWAILEAGDTITIGPFHCRYAEAPPGDRSATGSRGATTRA